MSALIVTAWIHADDLRPFHRLRRRFFPRNRTFVSAHVTLFHHLPAEREGEVVTQVRDSVSAFAALHPGFRQNEAPGAEPVRSVPVQVQRVFPMGRGVAYAIAAEPLAQLRQPIAEHFAGDLTEQDARPWRNPHITVQNKVDPGAARRLHRHLDARFEHCTLRLCGLQVWRYHNGPWRFVGEYGF